MRKLRKSAVLVTCILSIQMINPITSLYANTLTLTYDGKQHIYDNPPITLQIDGKTIETTVMPPIQIDNRTLVPAREVFEPLGASVEWKSAEKKAFVNYGEILMILEADKQEVWVNGEEITIDVPTKIINNKVMLPLRFIGETLGFEVDWNNETRNVNISKPIPEPSTPNFQTKVKEVKVDNIDNRNSLYTIYFEQPVEQYSTFIHNGNIVVDILGAQNLLPSRISLPDNPYVDTVRTSQFTEDTTRVVLDMKAQANSNFELANDRMSLTIKISYTSDSQTEVDINPLYKNIEYIYSEQETIVFKKENGITVDNIIAKDDYRNRKITFTLPGNYADTYGSGIMNIGSITLDKLEIKSSDKTEFVIYEKKIRAFDIIDDGENIKIIFMNPKEKYNNIVLLDLGHGGTDGGASGNGLLEKNVNFEQGMHVYALLKNDPNVKVYITREDDTYPTNPYRAQLANEIEVDIFVSLHNNAFTSKATKGTEVLYSTTSSKSKQMAQIVQRNMIARLGTYDRGAKARPDLIVLNSTNMPAILIETAFLTNDEDAQKLKSSEFNKKVGQVVYDSIIEIFNTLSFR